MQWVNKAYVCVCVCVCLPVRRGGAVSWGGLWPSVPLVGSACVLAEAMMTH